jgi:DNA-binding transcriptional LysR family regulator
MITLLQLDYFRKLAAVEHITRTAQELHISQTALSSMIINLEKELGVQLFDRSKRTIRLNDAGRTYLQYVRDIFASLDNGKAAVQNIYASKGHTVSLATGTSSVWAPLFHDFCKVYPQYTLKQTNLIIPYLENALREMTVDFVIAGENDLHIRDMERSWFKTDSIYLCVSSQHPLAGRESVYMNELIHEKFISLNESAPWRTYCDWIFARAGYTPHVVLECDYTLRASLIESNFGVALTSESAMTVDMLKPNCYIHIADEYATRKMYLFHNPRRYMSDAANDFRQFCINYYQTKA